MPKRSRHKLLLDEMLPRKNKLPLTNHYHDVKHIVHDFNQAGITDKKVITISKNENRIIITNNSKHFIRLGKIYQVDVIGVPQLWPIEKLDKKLSALLKHWPDEPSGKYFDIK